MVSAAGWRVERTVVPGEFDSLPTAVLRVSWRGYWQADCASTAEVATLVDLATLVPDRWTVMRPPIAKDAAARKASGSRYRRPSS